MAPHSILLPGKIPWMEEPGGLQSLGSLKSQTRLSDFTFTFHFHALLKEMAAHSSVLAWRIPGMGEPGGLLSMGLHRVRHDWSDLAVAAAAISTGPKFWNTFPYSVSRNCLFSALKINLQEIDSVFFFNVSEFRGKHPDFIIALCWNASAYKKSEKNFKFLYIEDNTCGWRWWWWMMGS